MDVKLDAGSAIIVEGYENGKRLVRVSLIATNFAAIQSVGTDGSKVEGLDENDIIIWGSDCFTLEKQLFILNKSGVWE